jgi:uncharacterized membrane protein
VTGTANAVVWKNGTITNLHQPEWTDSRARAINGNEVIAGDAELPSGQIHAVLWQNGSVFDINPAGFQESHIYAMNNSGQMIGWGVLTTGEIRAFMLNPVK